MSSWGTTAEVLVDDDEERAPLDDLLRGAVAGRPGWALAGAAQVASDPLVAEELLLLAMELLLLGEGQVPGRLRTRLPFLADSPHRQLIEGLVLLAAGRPGRAEQHLRAAITAGGRAPGSVGSRAVVHLADAQFRLGQWDSALAHLGRVGVAGRSGGSHPTAAIGARIAAMIFAGRGAWDAAGACLSGARRTALPVDLAPADAHLAYCRHDPAGVVLALRPLQDGTEGGPAGVVWEDTLADAFTALGGLAEATGVLAAFESRAIRLGPAARGGAARARGNLAAARGDCEEAEASFHDALSLLAEAGQPFEEARGQLAFGSFLRRAASRRRAAEQLRTALAGFRRLGAVPFEQRCQHELEACGLTPAKRRAGDRLRLTPREMTVARLAAIGRTNPQIASILVVNLKTVEYHLSNVYGKLGLSGRAGLAAKLRVLPDAGGEPSLPTPA